MNTICVVLSGWAYWLPFILLALGSRSDRVIAYNLPRNFRNCSDCNRALTKNLEQLRRLSLIRKHIESALRAGREVPPVEVQSDGIPSKQATGPPPKTEEKEEIISFSQTIGRRDDSSILEFIINTGAEDKDLQVVSADLWIRVKKRGGNKKGKRIVLKVFQQNNGNHALLTYLRTKVKKTRWQKLSLPISLIQTLVEPPQGKLQLRIDCRRCGRVVKLVLPKNKHRRKRKKKRRPSPRGLRTDQAIKRRPFLHIFTLVKVHSQSKGS